MKLIDREYNAFQNQYTNTWMANNKSEIATGFDPDAAVGSMIIVVSAGCTYIKNADGKWQKFGSTEVI